MIGKKNTVINIFFDKKKQYKLLLVRRCLTFSDREITEIICILSRKTFFKVTASGVKVFGVNVLWYQFDEMSRYHGVKVGSVR